MEDFGDIIYVIAIIGYIIYSFVSGAKKQKAKRKAVEEKTSRPVTTEPSMEEVLEQLLGKKREQEKPQQQTYETSESTIEPVYETITEVEGQSMEGKALNPVENYEFGKYRTLEDDAVNENATASQYEKFNTINYSETSAPHSIAEKEGIKEVVHLEEEKETTSFAKEFDIEKAIIYSEILKRPKWAV